MENVKNDAPIVGLTFCENVLPTCLNTTDVLPTPIGRDGGIGREGEVERWESQEGEGRIMEPRPRS